MSGWHGQGRGTDRDMTRTGTWAVVEGAVARV